MMFGVKDYIMCTFVISLNLLIFPLLACFLFYLKIYLVSGFYIFLMHASLSF